MKIFIYILIVLAVALFIFNLTFLDFGNLLEGDSAAAMVGVLASSCVILILVILLMSRSIAKKAGK
ncbi:MAG TPA: hypothetical protein VFM59_01780 [Salinimicrobium sp.]|nr:hypothetical protein [Salinimicrobium sp.]